jgi:hypothetical protein
VCMSAPVVVMSSLLSHTDRKGTRAAHLSKMVPITCIFFHYMVSLPDAVKAECHFDRKLAGFFDRNLAGSKVGEVADGR